jgi:type IV secretory pathway TrbL component
MLNCLYNKNRLVTGNLSISDSRLELVLNATDTWSKKIAHDFIYLLGFLLGWNVMILVGWYAV